LVDKFPGLSSDQLMEQFKLSLFLQRWGRVKEFKAVKSDFRKWTFRTYVERSAATFENGDVFFNQIRNMKKLIKKRLKARLVDLLGE